MNCPKCDAERGKVCVTQPADRRGDRRTARHRKCKECGHNYHTLEVYVGELRRMEQQALNSASTGSYSGPLPSAPTVPLLDIEHELEELLRPSLDCLRDTLVSVEPPHKTKVDTARWLVDDRRQYRKALAEASNLSGTQAEDESVKELAKILALVPPPPPDEDDLEAEAQ